MLVWQLICFNHLGSYCCLWYSRPRDFNWTSQKMGLHFWFHSYPRGRTFSVDIGVCKSFSDFLFCGVPQESVLGPLLFCIYMLPLGHTIRKYDINFHFYTDDTQLYFSFDPTSDKQFTSLRACINKVQTWLSNNFLDKSKVIIIVQTPCNHVSPQLGSFASCITSHCRNLDVTFDNNLIFNQHAEAVSQSFFSVTQNL